MQIYWISPNRIKFSLGGLLISENSIMGGDWDLDVDELCSDSDVVYRGCKDMLSGIPWHQSALYSFDLSLISKKLEQTGELHLLSQCEQNVGHDRQKLCDSVKKSGVCPTGTEDEVCVAINREGNLILVNGFHRFALAKLLCLKQIPVRIIRIHSTWQQWCENVNLLCQSWWGTSVCYHSIDHISFYLYATQWSNNRIEILKNNINKQHKTVLDIGALFGYFCTQLEELGYDCLAVENYSDFLPVLKKVKTSGYFNFKICEKSVFDINEFEFDTVLAFNIFHHFLKDKNTYQGFINFLQKLKIKELFVQLHDIKDNQMKKAYKNYNNEEFLQFLGENTGLKKYEYLGEENNRKIFKLS